MSQRSFQEFPQVLQDCYLAFNRLGESTCRAVLPGVDLQLTPDVRGVVSIELGLNPSIWQMPSKGKTVMMTVQLGDTVQYHRMKVRKASTFLGSKTVILSTKVSPPVKGEAVISAQKELVCSQSDSRRRRRQKARAARLLEGKHIRPYEMALVR